MINSKIKSYRDKLMQMVGNKTQFGETLIYNSKFGRIERANSKLLKSASQLG